MADSTSLQCLCGPPISPYSEYTANGAYCTRITRVLIAPKFLGNLTAEICDDDDNDGYTPGEHLEMAELS